MAPAILLFETFDSLRFRHDGGERSRVLMSPRSISCVLRHSPCPWFSWSMFFDQHVGLHQANCADLPLSLPVVTDGGVGSRWNYADNFDAVIKGATLTNRCLDGLCDSFRDAGPPVHEVTPAALSGASHGVCGHADKRIFRLWSPLRILMYRRRSRER